MIQKAKETAKGRTCEEKLTLIDAKLIGYWQVAS